MALGWHNPYASKSSQDYQSYYDTAFAPTGVMTSADDWFDPTHDMYASQGTNARNTMYDTIAKRFLAAAGDEIADQNARIAFGKNLASQRDVQLAKNVAGGSIAGTGNVRDALGGVGGDWLRSGRFGGGVDAGQTYAQIAANLADPNASDQYKSLANSGYTRNALGTLFGSQMSGPYRQLYGQALTDAELAAGGADPHTGFYGTLNNNPLLSPYRTGLASNIAAPAPVAPAAPVVPVTPTPVVPGPTPLPLPLTPETPGNASGAPGYGGTGAMGRDGTPMGAPPQTNALAAAFREVQGVDPDLAQMAYLTRIASNDGLDAALQFARNNIVAQAIRASGQPAPKINGSGDVAGASAFHDFVSHWVPGAINQPKQEYVENLLRWYQANGM